MKNNIAIQRTIVKITQQELANEVKVSRQTINAIELGKYVPSTILALKISHYFKKSTNEIFQLEDTD